MDMVNIYRTPQEVERAVRNFIAENTHRNPRTLYAKYAPIEVRLEGSTDVYLFMTEAAFSVWSEHAHKDT